ncbi:MAG: DUF1015 domain-containing protein [Candidatus Thermoplasmatota archaeon]|nr:DUF1015 domain-containing protein [Candidatus Thermoplasmatota archaeon]
MVEIAPFKGITYNKEKVDINKVVAPPYDIISKEEQDELYKKSEYNVVRLVLGKEYSADSEENNRYVRAADFFREWMDKGVFTRSEENCIYVYEEDYNIKGKSKKMRGFIALLKLEDYGHGVMRHEKTLSKPKEDRLKLMKNCNANFDQIFLLYSEPEKKIDEILDKNASKKPDYEVKYNDVVHRLWTISNGDDIDEIVKTMKPKPLFIADGHHRYETALNYRNYMREKHSDFKGNEFFNYMMVQFNNMDERLSILPTYRLIHSIPEMNIDVMLGKIKEFFDVEKIDLPEKKSEKIVDMLKEKKNKKVFALYHDKKCYILILKDISVMNQFGRGSEILRKLDVSILHTLIIEKIMGITDVERHVKYTRDENEAVQIVDEGKYQLSLFLNATTLDELKAISETNENMPQKSTYFYPKQLTGLVMNVIDGK